MEGSLYLWDITEVAGDVGENQLLVASVCPVVFLLPRHSLPLPPKPFRLCIASRAPNSEPDLCAMYVSGHMHS